MNAEELRNTFYAGCAAAALGVGLLAAGDASAQNAPAPGATAVTQTGFHADSGTVLAATSSANCTTTQAAVAQGTLGVTITPPSGWFTYLTGVFIEVGSNGTGSTASTTAWTVTNAVGNAPVWLIGSPGAVTDVKQEVQEIYPTGLKVGSSSSGLVIAPLATLASSFTCAKFLGYFSPI